MKKIGVYLLVLTLLQSLISPISAMAFTAENHQSDEVKEAILESELTDTIDGYKDVEAIEQEEVFHTIPMDSEVSVLLDKENAIVTVKNNEYILVRYDTDAEPQEEIEVYVASNTVKLIEEDEVTNQPEADETTNEDITEDQNTEDKSDVEQNDSLGEERDEKDIEQENQDLVAEDQQEEADMPEEETKNEDVSDEGIESKNAENKIQTFSMVSRSVNKESKTSKLGHIRSSKVQIYKTIGGKSFSAGSKYTNAVYYIKRETKVGATTYYLISTSPSATKGVVGWVKSNDLSIHNHVGVDKKAKSFLLNGKGKATSKAWGGSKDTVHASLSKYQNSLFTVNLTEKVGKNTWYRGKINGQGQNVWVHSSYVGPLKETKTSKLGHIRSSKVQIYENVGGKSFSAGSKYTNAVYYIKRETRVGATTYYLISTSPSATKGVVGWVKSNDLSTHNHVGVDKKAKVFTVKGNGKATLKAWGGSKDTVYSNLTKYKGQSLHVNLTEKVGNNIWYRGKLNGKGQNIWLHSSFVDSRKKTVVVDAGHGGSDPGASRNGLMEKDITLDVSKRVESLLRNEGYEVIMTRSKDEYVHLKDRTKLANDADADLFISIHVNSGGGQGIETWWYDEGPNSKESKQLAEKVQSELIKTTNSRDRGVKNGNLHVNRESNMPSSLVEIGFIDNKTDVENMKKDSFKQAIAKAIVQGIKKFFGS